MDWKNLSKDSTLAQMKISLKILTIFEPWGHKERKQGGKCITYGSKNPQLEQLLSDL